MIAYTGCISGALLIDEYERLLKEAGFADVAIIDSKSDLNAYTALGTPNCCAPSSQTLSTSCCGPSKKEEPTTAAAEVSFGNSIKDLLAKFNPNDFASSVKVLAIKPN